MALSMVVEDGSQVSGANSYATLAAAETYHEKTRYLEVWQDIETDEQERLLVEATSLLDSLEDGSGAYRWKGSPASTTQALQWPRAGVYDTKGAAIEFTSIPQFLIDAVSEYARRLNDSDRVLESEQRAVISETISGKSRTVQLGMRNRAIIPTTVLAIIRPYVERPHRVVRA